MKTFIATAARGPARLLLAGTLALTPLPFAALPGTSSTCPAPAPSPSCIQTTEAIRVLIETDVGAIEVELDARRAPATVANFLRYVDAGRYDGGSFHRAVRLDNQVRDDVLVEVIQGGGNPSFRRQQFAPIPLERTRDTGLLHVDGTLSMARSAGTDTARSDFFICIGDQPSLDYDGARSADRQGFAAFGRVLRGMDVVRRIQQSPTGNGESLTPPITITRVSRID